MTKRQIIKWLELQRSNALAEVETQSTNALDKYYAERNEKIGLDDTAAQIVDFIQQALKRIESFEEGVKSEYPEIEIRYGYYGTATYKLIGLSSITDVLESLLREIDDSNTPAVTSILKRKSEVIEKIRDNYYNVIANVRNMKNAKLAIEYLKTLGFDLSDLIKANETPLVPALSIVDTRFLFVGGNKNEVE